MKFNPYSPGAGLKPFYLSGRDKEIAVYKEQLLRIEHSLSARPIVLYGLRGVGKTALLGTLRNSAVKHGWITGMVEASENKALRESLSAELGYTLTDLAKPHVKDTILLKVLKTASLFHASLTSAGQWSFGIDLSQIAGSNANTGNIETDLYTFIRDISELAKSKNTGVALFVDEAQDLSKADMSALSELAHRAGQNNLPFFLVLAGLPSLPKILADSKSYAERLYQFIEIGALSVEDSKQALIQPAKIQEVHYLEPALDLFVELSDGYPYFLQEYGFNVWQYLGNSSVIDLQMAQNSIKDTQHSLDVGFFRSRWERATKMQKEYLRAMAEDSEVSLTASIAERMAKTQQAIGPFRAELIKKGLIYQPSPGQISFTVPNMADYIRRVAIED